MDVIHGFLGAKVCCRSAAAALLRACATKGEGQLTIVKRMKQPFLKGNGVIDCLSHLSLLPDSPIH